jgi:hypothetical protein
MNGLKINKSHPPQYQTSYQASPYSMVMPNACDESSLHPPWFLAIAENIRGKGICSRVG